MHALTIARGLMPTVGLVIHQYHGLDRLQLSLSHCSDQTIIGPVAHDLAICLSGVVGEPQQVVLAEGWLFVRVKVERSHTIGRTAT